MDIKRENYEIWAIDYLEGKLNPSEIALFMAFLAENPDLAEELDNIRDSQNVTEWNEVPENFDFLKKNYAELTISPESFEEFCIAYHEGDLGINDQKKLLEYIGSDSAKRTLFDTYKSLKVEPNKSLVFHNKIGLQKRNFVPIVWNRTRILQVSSSIAAAILIFIILNYNGINTNTSTNTLINTAQLEETNIEADLGHSILANSIVTHSKGKVEAVKSQFAKDAAILISNHLATEVFDTNAQEDIFIPMSRIDIASVPSNYRESTLDIIYSELNFYHTQIDNSLTKRTFANLQHNAQLLLVNAGNLSLDALLRKGVDGLNQVAEADLQYNSETDDDGRIVAFALSSERLNFKRKIKNN